MHEVYNINSKEETVQLVRRCLTLEARALRRGGHPDRAAAALRPVHGRQGVVPLLLVAEPDEPEAFGRSGHGVGHDFRPQHRGVGFRLERLLEVGIRHLRREIPDEDRVLRRLFYALPARAPVQPVAQRGALCVGANRGRDVGGFSFFQKAERKQGFYLS